MGNKRAKALDSVLKKGNLKLDDLLEHELVLSRARGEADPVLAAFLRRPETLHDLLTRMVEPYETYEKSIRYPYVCCELLVSQIDGLLEELGGNPNILEVLWSFLGATNRVDSHVLVHLTRILSALINASSKLMLLTMRERGGVLDLFLKHLENTPSADFLCRLIEMESASFKALQWFDEEGFFAKALGMVGQEWDEAYHFALYQFIDGLFMRVFPETYPSVALIQRFTRPEVMAPFVALIFSPDSSTSTWFQGVSVLSCFAVKLSCIYEENPHCEQVIQQFVSVIIPRLKEIAAILEEAQGSYLGPHGEQPRMGVKRIKASRLLADLALLRSPELMAELKALGIAEGLFNLFFSHAHNTFFLSNVVDFFTNLCHGDWAQNKAIIMESVLRKAKLLSCITQAQRIADTLAELPRRPRPNFMGHVTLIADQIHLIIEKHGPELYKEAGDLLRRESWIEYSNKSYRETKLKDAYILGGEQAPLQPLANEDVFTSVFTGSADESIVRYFCHEIISNFPANLHMADLDDFDPLEEEDDMIIGEHHDGDEMMGEADDGPPPKGILGSTLLGNRGGDGFENIMTLELELRLSNIDDDDDEFDLGPDSEDEHLFD